MNQMIAGKSRARLIGLFFLLWTALPAFSQFPSDSINFDESAVIPYTLPNALRMPGGTRVHNAGQWMKLQRPHIYRLFEENIYGRFPPAVPMHYRVRESSRDALGGLAVRKQVRLFLKPGDTTVYADVLLYLPKNKKGPVPVFLGLNFSGNATIINDPFVFLSDRTVFPDYRSQNTDSSRGTKSSRWPVTEILSNGIGLVTACYSDFEEDRPEGWKTGIRTTLKDVLKAEPDEWGAIGAWAWGLSRIMDYLETDQEVDTKAVAVMGLSRLGKTALWAGASDTRFSIVISNESGEGGAALARRWYGETVKKINTSFPHWFAGKYKTYNDDVNALPVDQHELLALIAPRPLYIASAEDDQWSDPQGEFLSAVHAAPVYALFGKTGLGTDSMPPVNHPVGHRIAYHIRTGAHDITLYDWKQYIKFVRKQWKIN
jgi:hypothetical protein